VVSINTESLGGEEQSPNKEEESMQNGAEEVTFVQEEPLESDRHFLNESSIVEEDNTEINEEHHRGTKNLQLPLS